MGSFIRFNRGVLGMPLHWQLWVGMLVGANIISPLFFVEHFEARVVLEAAVAGPRPISIRDWDSKTKVRTKQKTPSTQAKPATNNFAAPKIVVPPEPVKNDTAKVDAAEAEMTEDAQRDASLDAAQLGRGEVSVGHFGASFGGSRRQRSPQRAVVTRDDAGAVVI